MRCQWGSFWASWAPIYIAVLLVVLYFGYLCVWFIKLRTPLQYRVLWQDRNPTSTSLKLSLLCQNMIFIQLQFSYMILQDEKSCESPRSSSHWCLLCWVSSLALSLRVINVTSKFRVMNVTSKFRVMFTKHSPQFYLICLNLVSNALCYCGLIRGILGLF